MSLVLSSENVIWEKVPGGPFAGVFWLKLRERRVLGSAMRPRFVSTEKQLRTSTHRQWKRTDTNGEQVTRTRT